MSTTTGYPSYERTELIDEYCAYCILSNADVRRPLVMGCGVKIGSRCSTHTPSQLNAVQRHIVAKKLHTTATTLDCSWRSRRCGTKVEKLTRLRRWRRPRLQFFGLSCAVMVVHRAGTQAQSIRPDTLSGIAHVAITCLLSRSVQIPSNSSPDRYPFATTPARCPRPYSSTSSPQV